MLTIRLQAPKPKVVHTLPWNNHVVKWDQQRLNAYLAFQEYTIGDILILDYMNDPEGVQKRANIGQYHVVLNIETDAAKLIYNAQGKAEPYRLASLSACTEFNRVAQRSCVQPWIHWEACDKHLKINDEARERLIDDYVQNYIQNLLDSPPGQ